MDLNRRDTFVLAQGVRQAKKTNFVVLAEEN